ncbi:MAG TPA: glycosyltransferase family 4 protein [Acetobacteraceae bacterium]|nr:glycosyltransferase family 4 protein [Acetobacteraceae bacterium]
MTAANAAILFERDGYTLGPRLMGRQAAGNAFLRAAVAGRQGEPLWAYARTRELADEFAALVRACDAAAEARWLAADDLGGLGKVGTLYLPGPGLGDAARLRLRAGPAAYSLCGVTHTTASHSAMHDIAGLLSAPVMPWDALICTSSAVAGTVRLLLHSEIEALRWRFGTALTVTLPQLPVIPLGVHCADFVHAAQEREAARAALGIAADEVVALFVGRLSFHAKAHPHAMYAALQATAQRTGRRLVLIQCGWFAHESIEQAFRDGARQSCPEVRAVFTEGRDADARRRSWAAADLFVSLSDNIQETFGLAPIEAMAAGLPVVVTDWDGYKDTVRDGVDGFRIPTWMLGLDGEPFMRKYEAGIETYDRHCGLVCQMVSVDLHALTDRLSDLVSDPELRRRMGEAGRRRACETFDWAVVYRQYQALWAELANLRDAARRDPERQSMLAAAPRAAATWLDPFRGFAHYPTAVLRPETWISVQPGADGARYAALASHPLFNYAGRLLPERAIIETLLAALGTSDATLQDLAVQTGADLAWTGIAVAILAKMGLVRLRPDA